MSLGKIRSIRIGSGGYQEAMFGVTFHLETKDGSTSDFWGMWNTERSSGTQWSEEDRIKKYGETFRKLDLLMQKAKVRDAQGLIGVPIEITWSGQTLESWRVLEEVL